MCFNAFFPVVIGIWGSYRTFKMWGLALENMSLRASFENAWPQSISGSFSFFLSASYERKHDQPAYFPAICCHAFLTIVDSTTTTISQNYPVLLKVAFGHMFHQSNRKVSSIVLGITYLLLNAILIGVKLEECLKSFLTLLIHLECYLVPGSDTWFPIPGSHVSWWSIAKNFFYFFFSFIFSKWRRNVLGTTDTMRVLEPECWGPHLLAIVSLWGGREAQLCEQRHFHSEVLVTYEFLMESWHFFLLLNLHS